MPGSATPSSSVTTPVMDAVLTAPAEVWTTTGASAAARAATAASIRGGGRAWRIEVLRGGGPASGAAGSQTLGRGDPSHASVPELFTGRRSALDPADLGDHRDGQ